MSRPDIQNPALARTILVGLTVECPSGENCSSCQLHDKRKLGFAEKFEWIQSLSHKELLRIYSDHCACLARKEEIQNAS